MADPWTRWPGTEFNPDLVRIDRFNLSASAKIKQMGAARGLPYLKRFLKQIERRQEHQDERFGRRYQQEILWGAAKASAAQH